MVFNDIDRQTASTICTLATLVGDIEKHEDSLISVAQNMGVPREDTLMLLSECDDLDIIHLENEKQKKEFLKSCFSHLSLNNSNQSSEVKLFKQVVKNLGFNSFSLN